MRDVGTLTQVHRKSRVPLSCGTRSSASGLELALRCLRGKPPTETIPGPLPLEMRRHTIR